MPDPSLHPQSPKDRLRLVRRIAISIVGFTILLLGLVMIVLPGPALLFIPIGLAILATEFLWARRILDELKKRIPKPRE